MRFLFKKLALLLISTVCTVNAAKSNVLFIGNSFTIQNKMPVLFKSIASRNGVDTNVKMSAWGAATWNAHSASDFTEKLITSRKWDHIVLQEQSFFLTMSSRYTHSIRFLKLLDKIAENHTDYLVLFQTWGYQYGNYPRSRNYQEMQDQLIKGYQDAYNRGICINNKKISRVGEVWSKAYKNFGKKLYKYDGRHPSVHGSFLTACIHFRSLFEKKVKKYNRPRGISKKDIKLLIKFCNEMELNELNVSNP